MSRQEWVTFIPQPVEKVYEVYSNIDNLRRMTPWFLRFAPLSPARPLTPGMLFDYQMRFFGVPMAWRTRIEEVDAPRYFSDSQVRGPYGSFLHRHYFYPVDGGTLMVDRVDWKVPFGPLGWVVNELVVRRCLDRVFSYRREAAAAMFPR